MAEKINIWLGYFRHCFSRGRSYGWFVTICMAFMVRTDELGVTSFIRALHLPGRCYESLLHFFRATSWSIDGVRRAWHELVKSNAPFATCNGRIILVGDGVKQAKEALRMPGVSRMVQESGTVSKPEHIFGHLWGAIGAVINGESGKRFCLPLTMTIQQGLFFVAMWAGLNLKPPGSHVVQTIEHAYEAACNIGKKAYIVLDRYFLTSPALECLKRLNATRGNNQLQIVTRAKKNCVAYELTPDAVKGKPGPKPKHGPAVKLSSLFDSGNFQKGKAMMYGKLQEVEYLAMVLLWGKRNKHKLLFVLVKHDDTTSIYVTTDLSLDPLKVIELYSVRFSIEETFREFKQRLFGFAYHFWSKCLPKLNRFAPKGEHSNLHKVTMMENDADRERAQKRITDTVKAISGYVLFGSIAMGILQLLAMDKDIAAEAVAARYLRTPSRRTPSEATIMNYLAGELPHLWDTVSDLPVFNEIQARRSGRNRYKTAA